MSVAGARAKIKDAQRTLLVAWQQARQSWDDPVSQSIERHHLDRLDTCIRTALGAMDSINETLERVRRDCGDEP
ncbi:MAG: hypothetical protein ACKORL_10395 [Phycisphaerales bacterium]|jgi:hypothetical protein